MATNYYAIITQAKCCHYIAVCMQCTLHELAAFDARYFVLFAFCLETRGARKNVAAVKGGKDENAGRCTR